MSAEFQTMESGLLPLKRGRLIKSLADSTIRGVIDAIVELVTNSDDSYLRLEQEGKKVSGRIDINVTRGRSGQCKEFVVTDEAAGMDPQTLKRAIEFSGETSGFREGRSVRGFFGRGLKESIIALGRGTTFTLKGGILSKAEIYYDEEKKDAVYNLSVPIANLPTEDLINFGFGGYSGTIVKIEVTNERKNHIPGRNTLSEQLSSHFALRDINSSPKRNIFLHLVDSDSKDKYESSEQLRFCIPIGKLVFEEKDIKLDEKNEIVHFKIFESIEQLDSPKNSHGKAGLLIKTGAAILDNQLFGYETDPNGLYFFGEVLCPGIAEAIRHGDDSIVDFNRGGLEWRHEYSKKLEKKSKEILSALVRERKEKLSATEETRIAAKLEKMLDKLCKTLGDLARDELEEPEPTPGEIESFMIRPLFANIELGVPRPFSIYVPKYLADKEGTKIAKISSSNNSIKVIQSEVTLDFHKKYEGILGTLFKVVGYKEGEVSTISATLGDLLATTEVRVGPQKAGKRKKKLGHGGGIFKKIIPDKDDNPIQRFGYEEGGMIRIYVKFPGVNEYLGENLEGAYTLEGKMLLGEILIEAFCRHIARKRVGKIYPEEVDPLMADMDRLRKKCTKVVYEIIFHTDLGKILE